MGVFVESLKRLYAAKNVTNEKLIELQVAGKLREEEVMYIKG